MIDVRIQSLVWLLAPPTPPPTHIHDECPPTFHLLHSGRKQKQWIENFPSVPNKYQR